MKCYVREIAYQVTEQTNWGNRESNFGTTFFHQEDSNEAKKAKAAAEKFVANQGTNSAWFSIKELERFVPVA